jgi:hypothetical protein
MADEKGNTPLLRWFSFKASLIILLMRLRSTALEKVFFETVTETAHWLPGSRSQKRKIPALRKGLT